MVRVHGTHAVSLSSLPAPSNSVLLEMLGDHNLGRGNGIFQNSPITGNRLLVLHFSSFCLSGELRPIKGGPNLNSMNVLIRSLSLLRRRHLLAERRRRVRVELRSHPTILLVLRTTMILGMMTAPILRVTTPLLVSAFDCKRAAVS